MTYQVSYEYRINSGKLEREVTQVKAATDVDARLKLKQEFYAISINHRQCTHFSILYVTPID